MSPVLLVPLLIVKEFANIREFSSASENTPNTHRRLKGGAGLLRRRDVLRVVVLPPLDSSSISKIFQPSRFSRYMNRDRLAERRSGRGRTLRKRRRITLLTVDERICPTPDTLSVEFTLCKLRLRELDALGEHPPEAKRDLSCCNISNAILIRVHPGPQ